MRLVLALVFSFLFGNSVAQTPPSCICFEEMRGASDFRNPVIFRSANDGTGRKFIGEQLGMVYVFLNGSDTPMTEPFLDISDIVITSPIAGDERGLLALTFHPNFRNNRKLYVYFSELDSSFEVTTLVELMTDANNPNRVDPDSERIILQFDQPFSNHNGGDLFFGYDGYLYVATGDGGGAGDAFDLSLDLTSLLGKILRIDVDNRDEGLEYRVPRDNPFYNHSDPEVMEEIWTYGIRNPWRVDIDQGDPNNMAATRGRIFVADVGQNRWEEVSLLPPNVGGLSLGWSAWEAEECFKPNDCILHNPDLDSSVLRPILSYPHPSGQSITGGHVYRGCENPLMQGLYFYSDYVTGLVYAGLQDGNLWTASQVSGCGSSCQEADSRLIGEVGSHWRWLSWGEDENEELYMLTTDNPSPSHNGGRIFRVVDIRNRQPICIGGPTRPTMDWPKRAVNARSRNTPNVRNWHSVNKFWKKNKNKIHKHPKKQNQN